MIRLSTFVLLAVLASAGLALAIFLRRGDAALAVDVYLLTVGGLALLAVIGRTLGRLPREAPTRLDRRPAGPPAQARPRELVKLEREVALATETAFDAHFRLRPTIRNIAATALRLRGVDLDAPNSAAAELLGPEAWALARPDNPRPRGPRCGRRTSREHRGRRRSARNPVTIAEVAERAQALLDEVERAVVGKREALELVLLGLLADGHVLIEDFPGLAKTLIARSFAQATSLDFGRIQFTPDLMPSDVTGSSVYNQRTSEFEFRPGPIFVNLLLADEINRAPPKTQAALLEAMQERQVTTEGETRLLERPFIVLATQNPIEHEGTYPLPEAQLDRFLLRISVGYPSREDEIGILEQRRDRRTDDVELRPVVDGETLRGMQRALEDVHVSEPIGGYIVDVVRATREAGTIQVGASPRGTLAILKLTRGACRARRPRLRRP